MSYQFSREDYQRRMAWYTQARFGMFIHWGLYAIPARGEWVRSVERIPNEAYDLYKEEFNPRHCDMRRWMAAAKAAGMRYVVLTAKHHDGFCLFDSAYTDFKSTNTPAGRDFVREYVDTAREFGLKVGLYFSLIDWRHPDFPHYGDANHPMRDNPACGNEGRNFGRYLDYLHAQVRELCTNYGKLDVLWFDFSYGELRGEAWRGTALMEMVRSLQPEVVVDNRLEVSGEGFGSLAACRPAPFHGDSMLIKKLAECVSKGGNLLLNVGPDAQGRFPEESLRTLEEIGRWMDRNGESVYDCGPAGLEKPEYGRITRKGDILYFHLFENTIGPLPLFGLRREQIRSIRRLADGSEVRLSSSWVHSDYPDTVFADLGPDPMLPDPADTVLEVRLEPGSLEPWR